MSEPEQDVTVEEAGVSVRKSLNDHQFETLAVVFDVRSSREGPATVTLTDAVPDDVPDDDIGFHPEYGGEHWRAEEKQVVFSREFGPGEQYTTVYGIRDFQGTRSTLLAEPNLEVAPSGEPAEGGGAEDLVSPDDSDAVREVIAGESDTLPGLEELAEEPPASPGEPAAAAGGEDDDAASSPVDAGVDFGDDPLGTAGGMGEEPATSDETGAGPAAEPAEAGEEADGPGVSAPEPASGDDEPGEEATGAGEAAADAPDGADDEVTVPVTGGIARVLAKELRSGDVSPEDRQLLRRELLPDEGSTDARIRRLQSQVADLGAYTDALEAFLDEEGGAEAALEEVNDRIDDLAADVESIEDTAAAVEDDVAAMTTEVDELAGTLDEVEADVRDTVDEVDAVASDVEAVAGDMDQVERRLDRLRDDLDRVDELDRRIDELEAGVADINDQLTELAAFRERLSSVFGPGGPPGEGDEDEDDEGP